MLRIRLITPLTSFVQNAGSRSAELAAVGVGDSAGFRKSPVVQRRRATIASVVKNVGEDAVVRQRVPVCAVVDRMQSSRYLPENRWSSARTAGFCEITGCPTGAAERRQLESVVWVAYCEFRA